jgi:hypothetical protein
MKGKGELRSYCVGKAAPGVPKPVSTRRVNFTSKLLILNVTELCDKALGNS